jgi:hypothetical protein
MTSEVTKSKRPLSHIVVITNRGTEIVLQVTSYALIFRHGSHPLIHGKITTSHANRGIKTLGRGSLTVLHSLNGRNLDQVRSSGSMGNVSSLQRYSFAD